MQNDSKLLNQFISLMLPAELEHYFVVKDIQSNADIVEIHLDEKETIPLECEGHQVISKGFLDPVNVRDFPIRGRKTTLVVRRRKWYDETSGKYITNKFNIVADGTRYSKEFAAFLKELLGEIPDYGPLS